MTRLRTFGIGFLVSAGVLAGAWAPVHADVKAYHGSFCKALLSTQQSLFNVSVAGIHVNSAVGQMGRILICPLIRDRLNSSNQIIDVAVELFDAPPRANCTLYTQEEDVGGLEWDSDNVWSPSSGIDVQIDGFDVSTFPENEGTYSLMCDLSGQDILYHVHVDEANTTD